MQVEEPEHAAETMSRDEVLSWFKDRFGFDLDLDDVAPKQSVLTACCYCGMGGQLSLLRGLCEHSAVDVSQHDMISMTPLIQSARYGYLGLVKFICERIAAQAPDEVHHAPHPCIPSLSSACHSHLCSASVPLARSLLSVCRLQGSRV